ncbi:MAG: FTR1 family protein [Candidatus Omnitrophica bacterium]|nr:FTR1 family protein [Candidatus Omnitrophota bacterium]
MSDCVSCWAEIPSGKDNPFFGEVDRNTLSLLKANTPKLKKSAWKNWINFILWALAACVGSVLVWQGVTSSGAPDPTAENLNKFSVIMNTGILVFREGLEAILVLAALTAGLMRKSQAYWKPVGIGAGLSFLASIATWFIVVGIISNINAPALDIQAGTGLLAIAVLLVIMNWFFHRIYWTGWIAHHNRRKQDILDSDKPTSAVFKGLVLVGFTSVYREGFEIVLFLQSLRLRAGSDVVFQGVLIGLALTAMVGVLTFIGHRKLPYRRMLIITGVLLAVVLMVMVGESVQEMQLANWIGTTALNVNLPAWLNTWFAIYNSAESLLAQLASIILVGGSYLVAQYFRIWRPRWQARRELVV